MRTQNCLLISILATAIFICFAPELSAKKDTEIEKIKKVLESRVHIKAENGEIVNTGQEAAIDPETGKIYVLTNLAGIKYEREGAGIVLDPKGFIATNHHTTSDAARIMVTLHDGSQFEATTVASYPERDLSILRIKPAKPLKPISFANSDDIKVSDQLYVIANSKEIHNVISGAQIVGVDQSENKETKKLNVNIIQFVSDLPFQEGDSGSPVLNKSGELVGFIEAGHAFTQNPFYAIPSNVIWNYYLEFLKSGQKKG